MIRKSYCWKIWKNQVINNISTSMIRIPNRNCGKNSQLIMYYTLRILHKPNSIISKLETSEHEDVLLTQLGLSFACQVIYCLKFIKFYKRNQIINLGCMFPYSGFLLCWGRLIVFGTRKNVTYLDGSNTRFLYGTFDGNWVFKWESLPLIIYLFCLQVYKINEEILVTTVYHFLQKIKEFSWWWWIRMMNVVKYSSN